MNIFAEEKVARDYDAYYTTEQGKAIDELEKNAIVDLLNPITPDNMLEIGCGTGHWTALFTELGFQVIATDVTDSMLSFAKKKKLSNVTFKKADVLNLPFQNEQFNTISVITALEFCGNIKQAFSEMCRVLKPNGWLIAGCLNSESILGTMKENDPVFKHGEFMSKTELLRHLSTIGKAKINECVYLSSDFKILDGTEKQATATGVFLAAAVQKTKTCTFL